MAEQSGAVRQPAHRRGRAGRRVAAAERVAPADCADRGLAQTALLTRGVAGAAPPQVRAALAAAARSATAAAVNEILLVGAVVAAAAAVFARIFVRRTPVIAEAPPLLALALPVGRVRGVARVPAR
jgi:hypothetical protein